MVDYLGKFETIESDFEYISRMTGCSARLPIANTTNHKDFTAYYDDELINICRDIYKRDFEIFGYE